METYDYEQLVFCQDKSSGLKAIIAIHDTTLGPALGGTRMWTYASESEAIEDALRLARGMTYKNAAAGLNLGGGKAVIIGDPRKRQKPGNVPCFWTLHPRIERPIHHCGRCGYNRRRYGFDSLGNRFRYRSFC